MQLTRQGLPFRAVIDSVQDPRNVITLQKHLHSLLDAKKFCFFPKVPFNSALLHDDVPHVDNYQGGKAVCHFIQDANELYALFHNCSLHDPIRGHYAIYHARFAYTMFPLNPGFLETPSLGVEVLVGANDKVDRKDLDTREGGSGVKRERGEEQDEKTSKRPKEDTEVAVSAHALGAGRLLTSKGDAATRRLRAPRRLCHPRLPRKKSETSSIRRLRRKFTTGTPKRRTSAKLHRH